MSLTTPLDQYIADHSSPEGDYLYRLFRATHVEILAPQMASGHIQGRLLKFLVKMINPKRILEIGTFTGYSALCMAEGLGDDGLIYTFEVEDELEDFTRRWIDGSAYASKVKFIIGDALEIVPTMGERFDMVFIDGNKREYVKYYEMGGFLQTTLCGMVTLLKRSVRTRKLMACVRLTTLYVMMTGWRWLFFHCATA